MLIMPIIEEKLVTKAPGEEKAKFHFKKCIDVVAKNRNFKTMQSKILTDSFNFMLRSLRPAYIMKSESRESNF